LNILKLTLTELEEIIDGSYDRFKLTYNDFTNFNKNNRIYKACSFIDEKTSEKYYFEYSIHVSFGYDFEDGINLPSNIQIVADKDSEINPIREENVEIIDVSEVKTEFELSYEKIVKEYNSIKENGFNDFDKTIETVTNNDIKHLRTVYKKPKSLKHFYYEFLSIAVKYKIDSNKLKFYTEGTKLPKNGIDKKEKDLKLLKSLAESLGYKLIKI